MKHPRFHYHRPATLGEALALLAELGDDAKVLAGGQSLLPLMALRLATPAHVIDIGGLRELESLTATANGVTVGALVRHADAETSQGVHHHAPLVAAALPHIGHRAIRTLGTVVGSIAHADPAAEMPAVCLAAGAEAVATSTRGERRIPAAELFTGHFTTTVDDDELVTEVRFPAWPPTAGAAVVEVGRRHGDYAMVGVACRVDMEGERISSAALSFFGVAPTPVRVATAEAALVGHRPDADAFSAAAEEVRRHLTPGDDIHASAAYRTHLAGVLTRQGLERAVATIGAPA